MKKNQVSLIIFVLLLGVIASGCTCGRISDAAEHIYSHRGASGEETEHTLAAYDLAILYGTKYIEPDIVSSKDGTLYVSHDRNAKRITDVDAEFADMTDAQVDALSTKDGQKILKLSDLFDRYGDSVCYVVEFMGDDGTVTEFVQLVKEYGYEKQIIVQCANEDILNIMEDEFPNMPKFLITYSQEDFEKALTMDSVDIVCVEKSLMNPENCTLAHQHKKEINVWTLNTTEEIRTAIELGVDTYFTDYTAKAMALEKKYR